MRRKKEDYIVIGLAIILLFVVFGIAYLTFSAHKATKPSPGLSPIVTNSPPITDIDANESDEEGTKPPVLIDKNDQINLLDKAENRQMLSPEDSLAKATVLASLPANEPSGILYKTDSIIIDYSKTVDLVMVEILTTDIAQAKSEATVWLRAKGLSQQALCNLPVMFYLNFEIAQTIKEQNSNIIFSPVAEGC